mgnify:CR=1 FL=1
MIQNNTPPQVNTKKLNYLLVMPRLVQNIGDGYSFPLGIAYISSVMKKAGYNVITLNLNHHNGDIYEIIKKEIEEKKIDVVATGGLSFQYNMVRHVVEVAKQVNNEIVTIVGGGIISGDPEAAMIALEYADFGVIGEGEITINELCNSLENSRKFSEIDGIIYKSGNSYITTKLRKEMENIDSIPWPDYKGFEIEKYLRIPPPGISGLNRQNTIFMLASRSCPYNCTFCFHSAGKKYRQRSLDSFFEELDYMVLQYNIKFICMADELFARNIQRVKEFCERIKKYNIQWWAQFRVDDITPELLAILKDGRCEMMSFGLESADNRILKSMRKGTTVEQIERTLKLVYDSGITLDGAFIFGDIEETWETANNTFKWWREHSEYKITLNLITVYPGSYLYKYACEKGIIKDKVQFLKDGCPQINVSKLTDKEYSIVVREIMESPMTFTKALSQIKAKIINYKIGRITLTGTCSVCEERNNWENVKLFASSFLACKKCGQRYNVVLPDEILTIIDNNITRLLERYGKLAVWGINYHTANLFKKSTVLKDVNIYSIEISELKRNMDLYGKQINPPDIITKENIEVIIIPIPAYINEITGRIKANYKNVKKVIDICELTNPDYFNIDIKK